MKWIMKNIVDFEMETREKKMTALLASLRVEKVKIKKCIGTGNSKLALSTIEFAAIVWIVFSSLLQCLNKYMPRQLILLYHLSSCLYSNYTTLLTNALQSGSKFNSLENCTYEEKSSARGSVQVRVKVRFDNLDPLVLNGVIYLNKTIPLKYFM